MSDTAESRVPTQERGTRRVEAILDAAAALVVEVGVEGLTVQMLADCAETSKGSLYHFFPDVPAVLRALADRHLQEIGEQLSAIMRDERIEWAGLAATDVVSYILAPLDYLEQNSDLLALVRSPAVLPRSSRSMEPIQAFVEFILGSRFPQMPVDRRTSRAATICAVLDGVVTSSVRACSRGSEGMRRELSEMLVIYVGGLAT
jgi:AcrR family transcriptional regulator